MNAEIETLVNDGFAGEPAKRSLAYIQSQRKKEKMLLEFIAATHPRNSSER
ncbi:MAG: hypothetical protein ABFD50_22465 [Smithella sp.]